MKEQNDELYSANKEGFDYDEIGSPATDEEMKSEALSRIKFLVNNIGLNPKIYTYFSEDRLYYSYLTACGFIGSIDSISYDAKYEAKARSFEKEYDTLVYHCVESKTPLGNFLVMLYVVRDKDEWPIDRPSFDGIVMANVYNFDKDFEEIGDVKLEAYQGALIRTM